MFEISKLKEKKLSELQEIAEELKISKYKTLKKLDLVYKILDHQASNPDEKESDKKNSPRPSFDRKNRQNKKIDLNKEIVNIHTVIDKSIKSVDLLLKNSDGSIFRDYSDNLPKILLAKSEMLNVFVNILENSIKYSLNSPDINIKTLQKKNKIIISISDKGIGMSKIVKSKIFDNFYVSQQCVVV